MVEIGVQKTVINSEIPMTYHHLNQGAEKPVLIFFHGYSDSAKAFLRRAYPSLDTRYEILAINGLFPVPQKKDGEWKQAFAWYFADFSAQSVLLHPEIAAKAVSHLIEKLNLDDREKVLIGFSQGGFFLPFVLPYLKKVKYLFGIGAAYREEDYAEQLSIPLDALHGADDDIVSYALAETSFKNFVASKNPLGSWVRFENLAHTMNDESRAWLKNRINEIFNS